MARGIGREVKIDNVILDSGMLSEELDDCRSGEAGAAFEIEVGDFGSRWDGKESLVVDECMCHVKVSEVGETGEKSLKDWLLQGRTFVERDTFELRQRSSRCKLCSDGCEGLGEWSRRTGAEIQGLQRRHAEQLGEDVAVQLVVHMFMNQESLQVRHHFQTSQQSLRLQERRLVSCCPILAESHVGIMREIKPLNHLSQPAVVVEAAHQLGKCPRLRNGHMSVHDPQGGSVELLRYQ